MCSYFYLSPFGLNISPSSRVHFLFLISWCYFFSLSSCNFFHSSFCQFVIYSTPLSIFSLYLSLTLFHIIVSIFLVSPSLHLKDSNLFNSLFIISSLFGTHSFFSLSPHLTMPIFVSLHPWYYPVL